MSTETMLEARRPAAENRVQPSAVRASLIELAAVEKVYRMGKVDYPALRGVDLSIDAADLVAVVGPSGSGKTTISCRAAPRGSCLSRPRARSSRLAP